MDYLNVEYSAFASWPAIAQWEAKGLIYRFANGYTKRANSANIIKPIDHEFSAIQQYAESFYTEKNQATIFRLPSFIDNANFDNYLQQQGYVIVEPSVVLIRDLHNIDSDNSRVLTALSLPDWMSMFYQVSAKTRKGLSTHQAMIQGITAEKGLFALEKNASYVACGLSVLHQNNLGLFDIATQINTRRQGCATQLIKGMLAWGASLGASLSYVQVVQSNTAAIRLYKALGYQHAYEYWYRVKDKIR